MRLDGAWVDFISPNASAFDFTFVRSTKISPKAQAFDFTFCRKVTNPTRCAIQGSSFVYQRQGSFFVDTRNGVWYNHLNKSGFDFGGKDMNVSIREWRIADKTPLAENLNNPKVLNNLRDGLPYPYTERDAEAFICTMLSSDKNSTFAFAITLEDKVIGSIGVFRQDNIHSRTAEMGYYIGEPYWGNAYATSAIKQVCQYVFAHTDIIRIYAEPFAHNTASCRALEKAGFTYEGTLKSNAVKCGNVVGMNMYALIKA